MVFSEFFFGYSRFESVKQVIHGLGRLNVNIITGIIFIIIIIHTKVRYCSDINKQVTCECSGLNSASFLNVQ